MENTESFFTGGAFLCAFTTVEDNKKHSINTMAMPVLVLIFVILQFIFENFDYYFFDLYISI